MSNARVIVLVQARMGSERFPKKMMADLHGKTIIEWVLKRCKKAKKGHQVVLATSVLERDNALADHAENLGFDVFRGDEQDVLGRFANTVEKYPADIIVRVCGDRPLVDPLAIDLAIDYYFTQEADLVYNHMSGDEQNWPRGFGVEVFPVEHLFYMHETQHDDYCREHVTPYLWHNQDKFKVMAVPLVLDFNVEPDIKLDLDTQEDLLRLQNLSGLTLESNMQQILHAYLN